jgi:hypothetical protein
MITVCPSQSKKRPHLNNVHTCKCSNIRTWHECKKSRLYKWHTYFFQWTCIFFITCFLGTFTTSMLLLLSHILENTQHTVLASQEVQFCIKFGTHKLSNLGVKNCSSQIVCVFMATLDERTFLTPLSPAIWYWFYLDVVPDKLEWCLKVCTAWNK